MYLSWVEISRTALLYNLRLFKKSVGSKVEVMPIVKSNAYGHGFKEIVSIIGNECDWLGVVDASEAISLRQLGFRKKIFVLSYVETDRLAEAVKKRIDLPVYDLVMARKINDASRSLNMIASVHLKIDTGAGRVGVLPSDAVNFVKKLAAYKNVKLVGLYSHFASAEDNERYTELQFRKFMHVFDMLSELKISVPYRHFACSAAIMTKPQARFNLVRLGVSLYGLWPSVTVLKKVSRALPHFKLRPALTWKTKVIQVKDIPAGTKVGYGCTYTAKRKMKLAIIGVGYWEGFDRKLSNRGTVIIKGIACPIVGRICMNISMVDVSRVKSVKAGDEITLLGGGQSAEEIAAKVGTINYEVVTRINPLLPRIIK